LCDRNEEIQKRRKEKRERMVFEIFFETERFVK
jgi:hypothetical protein